MDQRYEVYSLADRYFYETPERLAAGPGAGTRRFETARREVPAGWRSEHRGDWYHLAPQAAAGAAGPAQGWKIHVSATLDNADKTAAQVWDYCVARRIPFKFVPAPHLLHLRNSKYAGRDGSGKFVTIYPADDDQLHTVLRELGEELTGREGPYVLTDLRWGDGPLYVRYGAFVPRFCVDERGGLVPAIADPDGRLVPDPRDPAFRTPEWVTLPPFLRPHLAAREATTVGDLPYRIDKALHFSNGGGVYRATDTRDGREVVLKEGRPHAGLAADGADAVTRLERERDALERLSGLGVAPEVRDWFVLGGHRFLVMDFVPGTPLNAFFATRHPLLTADPDPAALRDYTAWAVRVHALVAEAIAAVHERGVVFNDLHMFNIMVSPDESAVTLIDFEAAAPADRAGRQVVAHPGFLAPPDRTGPAVDRYALACLRLALFLPVTSLLVVDREKAAHLAEVISRQFPVPDDFLAEAVAEITRAPDRPAGGSRQGRRGAPPAETDDWPAARDAMTRAVLASATPERDDRLFPGDIAQFGPGGGLGLEHGAAGVLLALHLTGAERHEAGERWLLRHTAPVPAGTPLGLYDGLAGVAHALHVLGHPDRALDLAHLVLGERWQSLGWDLRGGLSGIALVLDELARASGDPALRAGADEMTRLVAGRLVEAARDTTTAPRRAGLMRGATGPALLLLRRYEHGGGPEVLDLAAAALRLDLARCVTRDSGGLEVDEGWRTMPYAGDGSVGVGLVLDDFLRHRPDEEFERARLGVLTAARSRFYAQPGLFQGRAGMVLHLGRTTTPGVTPADVTAQAAALGWYGMTYQGGLAFPGHQMMRLSMDLGTGTAGVLLALGGQRAWLPFLPPPAAPQTGSTPVEPQ